MIHGLWSIDDDQDLNLVDCDAVDDDPEAALAGQGGVHQERLHLVGHHDRIIFLSSS